MQRIRPIRQIRYPMLEEGCATQELGPGAPDRRTRGLRDRLGPLEHPAQPPEHGDQLRADDERA